MDDAAADDEIVESEGAEPVDDPAEAVDDELLGRSTDELND